MNSKRKLIIGVLALLVVMTMGYALFSETVNVNGTAKADGNLSLDLYNPDGSDSLIYETNGVGSSGTVNIDASRKILTVTANLDYPTAYVEIPVKIRNTGSTDLYIGEVKVEGVITDDFWGDGELESHPINNSYFDFIDLNYDDLIKINEEKLFVIKTRALDEYDKKLEFKISFIGVQDINDIKTGLPRSPFKYAIGREISIGTENFNIIKENDNTVSLLAQYNLAWNERRHITYQDRDEHKIAFFTGINKEYGYWTDDKGNLLPEYGEKYPVDVYNKAPSSNPTLLDDNKIVLMINDYVSKLKEIKNISPDDNSSISGRLINYSELIELGYSSNLSNAPFNEKTQFKWLRNYQNWWTGVALYSPNIPHISMHGDVISRGYNNFQDADAGVRPVIIINKKYLD